MLDTIIELRETSLQRLNKGTLIDLIKKIGVELCEDTLQFCPEEQRANLISEIVGNKDSQGYKIRQFPEQYADFLLFLINQNITYESYLEIGTYTGGSFCFTSEILYKINPKIKTLAIDLYEDPCINDIQYKQKGKPIQLLNEDLLPFKNYLNISPFASYEKINSQSPEFKKFLHHNDFDIVFIDGDHTYEGVKNDFLSVVNYAYPKTICFHDILDKSEGVYEFWEEVKNEWSFHHNYKVKEIIQIPKTFENMGITDFPAKCGIGILYRYLR